MWDISGLIQQLRMKIDSQFKSTLMPRMQVLCPSTKDFKKSVEDSLIPNCPIIKADIICTEEISGPDL